MRANISAALTIALASAFAFGFGETGHAAEQPAFAQGSGGAGQPRVLNGRLASQPAGNLDATFRRLVAAQPGRAGSATRSRSSTAARDGSAAPATPGSPTASSSRTDGSPPAAWSRPRRTRRTSDQPAQMQNPVRLEGPDSLVVLYRVEEKAVQRIRIFSPDCELDAGGLTIQWLEGVSGRGLGEAARRRSCRRPR